MKYQEFQKLYELKAKVYEKFGKEHYPLITSKEKSKECDISSHLHCEIVELWLAVVQNQSIEQVVDELADILCIWNLALVLYEEVANKEIGFDLVLDEAKEIMRKGEFFLLNPDPRNNWEIKNEGESDLELDELIKIGQDFLKREKICVVLNFGSGNEIDIFNLLHKSVNDFWNAVRKQEDPDKIFHELVKIFIIWLLTVEVISKHMKFAISIGNIINLSASIFVKVAKKKFNINI